MAWKLKANLTTYWKTPQRPLEISLTTGYLRRPNSYHTTEDLSFTEEIRDLLGAFVLIVDFGGTRGVVTGGTSSLSTRFCW